MTASRVLIDVSFGLRCLITSVIGEKQEPSVPPLLLFLLVSLHVSASVFFSLRPRPFAFAFLRASCRPFPLPLCAIRHSSLHLPLLPAAWMPAVSYVSRFFSLAPPCFCWAPPFILPSPLLLSSVSSSLLFVLPSVSLYAGRFCVSPSPVICLSTVSLLSLLCAFLFHRSPSSDSHPLLNLSLSVSLCLSVSLFHLPHLPSPLRRWFLCLCRCPVRWVSLRHWTLLGGGPSLFLAVSSPPYCRCCFLAASLGQASGPAAAAAQ